MLRLAPLALAAILGLCQTTLAAPRTPAHPGPAAPGLAAQDEEIVKEFKKYFRKYKDPDARIEAVLALLGAETPGVVDALVPVLGDKDPEVGRAAARVLASSLAAAAAVAVNATRRALLRATEN